MISILKPGLIQSVKIYSVGVWNNKFVEGTKTDLKVKIYSVGVWNYNWEKTKPELIKVKIYSVGVWNFFGEVFEFGKYLLKFTPLEFETIGYARYDERVSMLKFTPLEFETQ